MSGKARRSPRSSKDRAIDQIYREIPDMIDCKGECAPSCGPIAMFKGEWDRVKRLHGREPRLKPGTITCGMLSPTGRCTVYTVRPFICRLWGTTRELACPSGCKPERWLSAEEARRIFLKLQAVAGSETRGTMGDLPPDLWKGIALEEREARTALIKRLKEAQSGS